MVTPNGFGAGLMRFAALPRSAAWRHREAREGFECAFMSRDGRDHLVEGATNGVEDGVAWVVEYEIQLDARWRTRSAHIRELSASHRGEIVLETSRDGWRVDGAPAPHLQGCLDIDLESSALTNTFPVRRIGLAPGAAADAPAAYVRAPHLAVERLEQHYLRLEDADGHQRYRYAAPRFEFACRITYDESGLVLQYPGVATRVALSR